MPAASGVSTTRSRSPGFGLSQRPEHLGTALPPSQCDLPGNLSIFLPGFLEQVIQDLNAAMTMDEATTNSVVAVMGIASLFGFGRVSDVIKAVANNIRGRLLVFFPGEYENNIYRLLDARGGWSYLSVPITVAEGM